MMPFGVQNAESNSCEGHVEFKWINFKRFVKFPKPWMLLKFLYSGTAPTKSVICFDKALIRGKIKHIALKAVTKTALHNLACAFNIQFAPPTASFQFS